MNIASLLALQHAISASGASAQGQSGVSSECPRIRRYTAVSSRVKTQCDYNRIFHLNTLGLWDGYDQIQHCPRCWYAIQ